MPTDLHLRCLRRRIGHGDLADAPIGQSSQAAGIRRAEQQDRTEQAGDERERPLFGSAGLSMAGSSSITTTAPASAASRSAQQGHFGELARVGRQVAPVRSCEAPLRARGARQPLQAAPRCAVSGPRLRAAPRAARGHRRGQPAGDALCERGRNTWARHRSEPGYAAQTLVGGRATPVR